ncbi:DUF4007 family protein [Hymenobacter rubripertinctus]|uniref:DUF4007 family protein n=1 Tax=Hymenobacter rubripertinctus TaxID=2029981 RepID=A0A418R2Z1_9BACT|nr:DUF4007 family protein [Hymenobacter rubripertinctus]RIY11778.1 DUF4007 family protein [Hymenobacter rubripertinctus]
MLLDRLIFQGHDTFLCRNNWLKKGYDFIEAGGNFNDDDAVVKLGVGKNMVTSIRYWLRAFGLTDETDTLKPVAHELLNANGFDPYIEDGATLWHLHYLLVSTGRASLYHYVFNELRKDGFSFSKTQLQNFINRKCAERNSPVNENTLNSDIAVFLRAYGPSGKASGKVDIEEESTGLLQDLGLLVVNKNDDTRYSIENLERPELPWQVVLRVIIENKAYGETISFTDLEVAPDSPGLVFALNEKGLFHKIEEMIAHFPAAIVYSSTAGNRVLTVKKEQINLTEVLQEYYGQTV